LPILFRISQESRAYKFSLFDPVSFMKPGSLTFLRFFAFNFFPRLFSSVNSFFRITCLGEAKTVLSPSPTTHRFLLFHHGFRKNCTLHQDSTCQIPCCLQAAVEPLPVYSSYLNLRRAVPIIEFNHLHRLSKVSMRRLFLFRYRKHFYLPLQ